MSIASPFLIAFFASIISYLIVYYVDTAYAYLSTSWQIFESYNYEKILYWCILILSLLHLARYVIIHDCMGDGDFSLSDGLIIRIGITLGCSIACIRRIRE